MAREQTLAVDHSQCASPRGKLAHTGYFTEIETFEQLP